MSFVPINGLRCLAIEIGFLGACTALLLFVFRYFPLPLRQPEWLRKVLAKNWRAVLLVIGLALIGRVALRLVNTTLLVILGRRYMPLIDS